MSGKPAGEMQHQTGQARGHGIEKMNRSQDVRHAHRKLPRYKSQTAVFVKALSCMSDIQKRKDHRVGMQRSGWQEDGRVTVGQVRFLPRALRKGFTCILRWSAVL